MTDLKKLISAKQKFEHDYNLVYAKMLNLGQKIDLGYWRLFFLRDLPILKDTTPELDFIVDGDSQEIKTDWAK